MSILSRLAPYSYSVTSSPEDPRLGQLIGGSERLDDANVVIFGIPTDEGVRRNGGRVGAAQAPDKIRESLAKLTPFAGIERKRQLSDLTVCDLGNVQPGELESMHDTAAEITAALIERGKFVIALGGGHDVTYPLVKGYATSHPKPSLINIDAHLDVRPRKNGLDHSGSSFRSLLEEGHVEGSRFTEFGIQPHVIAREHYEWLLEQRSSLIFLHDLFSPVERFASILRSSHNTYISFDVDAIEASDAPGVSAPAVTGLTSREALSMAYEAGYSSQVGMIDFVEASPPHDVDARTTRLVARMVANVMQGFADR